MMVIMCLETVMAKVRSRASDNAIRLMTQTLEVASYGVYSPCTAY